jgi:ribonuclease HI
VEGQKPVYFTSKALLGPETRYQRIEKVALALLTAARRLRQCIVAHTVIVRIDQPIRQILGRPDVAGRMVKWSLELSEFDIHYESREALKAQVFANFLAEMNFPAENYYEEWTVFVDESSNSKGSGAGIIVEDNKGITFEISPSLSFLVTNNTAEYEAFLAGLQTAQDMGAKKVKIFTDSQLVASQVTGEIQVKEDHLQKYVQLVLEKMKEFEIVEVTHVPREQNTRADILSKLASTRTANGNKTVTQEVLDEPIIQDKGTQSQEINSIIGMEDWRGPISRYIENGELPSDPREKTRLKRRACSFTLVEGTLYKRGFITPLIKSIGPTRPKKSSLTFTTLYADNTLAPKLSRKRSYERDTIGLPC